MGEVHIRVLWARLFRALICGMIVAGAVGRVDAEPYFGKRVQYRQPDGATFTVFLWGDEFFAYQETEDGYLVVRDPESREFCYARVTADGADIVSTGVRVGAGVPAGLARRQRLARGGAFQKSLPLRTLMRVDERGRPLPDPTRPPPPPGPPSFTTTGQRVGLVLLASFPDRPQDITISRSEIDAYCNDPSYTNFSNATSVYGYFHIQSNGELEYNCIVTAYFTAANNRDYYTDPAISYGTRARELIKEGLAVLDAAGFDCTECDADGNNIIDGVNCFYAGNRANGWAEGLWPHKSSTSWSGFPPHGLASGFQYQITDIRDELSLGTFCHENGHMLCGYPDLYSYNGNAARIANYSIMASSGSKHPVNIDPYLKMHSGWADIVDLDSSSHQWCGVQVDRNYFYRYRNPDESREYFLLEVRDNVGYEGPYGGASGNVNPTAGLVVYHAREHGRNTYSSIFTADNPTCDYSTPYELMVVEANPAAAVTPWYDDPTPNSNDALHSGGVDELSDATTPALKFWTASGRTSNSFMHVHSISAADSNMTFIVGTGTPGGSPAIGLTATALTPSADLGTDAASQAFGVYNAAGGTLSYTVGDDAGWLSVSPASGTATGEVDQIAVDYSTSSLTSGTYNATITVTDAGASNSPQTIPVTLTVHGAPAIAVSPGSLNETVAPGVSTQVFIEVSNAGGGTMDYTISESLDWLSLDGTGGTVAAELDRIAVTFDDRMPSGTYNGSIQVTSTTATNSPRSISVTFTVTGNTKLFVTAPDGGETLHTGSPADITWNASPSVTGNMRIELLKGGSLHTTLVANTANDGVYAWTPSQLIGDSDFRIRITNLDDGGVTDDSDADFSIRTAIVDDNLDSDPGYAVDSPWQYAVPGAGNDNGGPTTAYTGTHIYDTNPNGAVWSTCYLTTPAFDCSSYRDTSLSFAGQFSFYNGYDATVQISTDGASWSNLYYISGSNRETSWQMHNYDISSFADGEPTIYIRWGHIETTGGGNWSGMAVDDILVEGVYSPPDPLLVVSHAPTTNALSVPVSADVVVTCNVDVASGTVDTGSFCVDGSLSGAVTGSYGVAAEVITFTPASDFAVGEVVTVTLTTNLQTTGGQTLTEALTWQFRVQAPYGPARFGDEGGVGSGSDTTLAMLSADANGDGHLDLVLGNAYQQNTVCLNDGDGTFDTTSHNFGTGSDGTWAMASGDLNSDGHVDLVVGNSTFLQNVVYLGDGDGTFDTTSHNLGPANDSTYALAVGDVNGDGHLDIAVGNGGGQQNVVYLNDGDGTFDTTSHNFGTGSDSTYALALGDVDLDGDLDIAVGNLSGQDAVYLNDGDGTFDTTSHSFGTGSDMTYAVVLGDLDGDGDVDIACGLGGQQNVVHLNDGDGTFGTTSHNFGTGTDFTIAMAAGDANGDGHLDIVVANNGSQQNVAYINDGDGTFDTTSVTVGSPNSTRTLALADLDGDGDLDVAAGDGGAQNSVHLNMLADLGDLPVAYNLTRLNDDGARHQLANSGQIRLGAGVDDETDGQENAGALGDDTGGSDDEDGITVAGSWSEGAGGGALRVIVSGGGGYLSGWVDWDDNGNFSDAGDQVMDMVAVGVGTQTVSFDVPAGAIPASQVYQRFARFRLSPSASPAATVQGLIHNGEVEDYRLEFPGGDVEPPSVFSIR